MGRRKRRYNHADLPKAVALKGQVIGAKLMGSPFNEEGVIARGASSERWRLTDDINELLAPDDEFIVGGSLQEVREALEARHPSPVAGASMFEVCNETDLKRHRLPFGESAIRSRKVNPDHVRYNWVDKYMSTWLPDMVTTLTRLCMGGNDLLISAEAEEQVRSMPDFDCSDLVIGKRDNWYSIVKYKPNKAAARRKTCDTIRKKEQHAADLVEAGRMLRACAAEAYESLCEDMTRFEVGLVLHQIPQARSYTYSSHSYDDADTKQGVRYLRALLRIHAALLGKHAYRYNELWQGFLKAVRERPKKLEDDTWGNYREVREWLEAECKIRKPKPTPKMIAAQKAAEARALQDRTCASCGTLEETAACLSKVPAGCAAKYGENAKLCSCCWETEFNIAAAAAEQPAVAGAV
jgi:hypothetical protein